MSSNNNDNGAGVALAFVFMAVAAVAIFLFAILAFIAFVMTILAILAWNTPLQLGKWTIEPDEARAFVGRGVAGAFLVPAFLLFVNVFLNIQIEWGYLYYMMLGGYVLGSVGVEFLMAEDKSAPPPTHPPPVPRLPAPPRQSLPRHEPEPFRFASWDDEEERS